MEWFLPLKANPPTLHHRPLHQDTHNPLLSNSQATTNQHLCDNRNTISSHPIRNHLQPIIPRLLLSNRYINLSPKVAGTPDLV